jgi:GYF domain 2
MQIYVGKNGQQLGPFSLEEINRKLADGTFAGTDLAWYEGAVGWAPLSTVAGVVIPPAAAATPAPAPAPTPAPVPAPVAPAPTPVRPNTSIVQPPRGKTKVLSIVSWLLMGITLVLSFIPFLGCGAWLLVWPVAVAAIIMGIMVMVRGATAQGIFIILAAIVMVPIALFGPVFTTAVTMGAIERKQETQILENLRQIDAAKTRWVSETKASSGTPVTMASLASQLGGKEVKPVIEETYDPSPVGQPPTATLPANKTLGPFSGGDALTAESVEKALASSSTFNWNMKRSTTIPFASPAPQSSPKPTAAPSVSASPNPSPSPKSSASPKSSSPPHSLISPRQSVEPEDSPSSGPSPSAKFAPRTGPRKSAPPSEEKPDSEKSGGLKQGRQYPRESPGSTPEKSPSDDDDDN